MTRLSFTPSRERLLRRRDGSKGIFGRSSGGFVQDFICQGGDDVEGFGAGDLLAFSPEGDGPGGVGRGEGCAVCLCHCFLVVVDKDIDERSSESFIYVFGGLISASLAKHSGWVTSLSNRRTRTTF